jgi:glyoxylase-like metal-dependent hydrolase (beta-lactamase superfamily II)
MVNRRTFLHTGASCAAHLLWMSSAAGPAARRLFAMAPAGRVVAQEPWGRLEQVGEGLWAMISTPLAGERGGPAWRTLCNGGIVAGRSDVLAIEAFASAEGARWLADEALRLTGRRPTVGLVTHFHGDHCGGLAGYAAEGWAVRVRSTGATRDLLGEREPLPEASLPATGANTTIDLGGRTVRVTSRTGHTASDVTIEVDDPRIVWCGDLVWHGMFPNYVHATPSQKARGVRALLAEADTRYVPGHGNMATRADVERYLALLDDVETKARGAIERGDPVDQAADAYAIPPALGEWVMFSPRYFRVAFQAWARELGGTQ